MSGPTYEVWSTRSATEWYAKRYEVRNIPAAHAGPFSTQEEAMAWARGEMDDSEAEEIAEANEYANISEDLWKEPDFTDPVYVTGAVQAQIEDLSVANKVDVLQDILGQITDPVWHLQAGHDVRIFYPDWLTGYVQWNPDPEAKEGGWADIMDSKSGEAGSTDGAMCMTCMIDLEVTEVLP